MRATVAIIAFCQFSGAMVAFLNWNLSLGDGIHLCLGAMFARMEMRLMLQEFLARFSDYEVISEPRYIRSIFVHGIKSMSIRLP